MYCLTATLYLFIVIFGASSLEDKIERRFKNSLDYNEGRERIFNGDDASPGEFPYQVSLRTPDDGHVCGGSILTEKHILTAAHCVLDYTNRDDSFGMQVVVGSVFLDHGGQRFNICKVVTHSWFDMNEGEIHGYDIAILTLEDTIHFSDEVSQIVLPSKRDINPGDPVNVTGWGLTNHIGGRNNVLQKLTNWSIISNSKCASILNSRLHPTELCDASHTDVTKGVCNGDSGSPLVKDGVQYGIASWVEICAKVPAVYARVFYFIDWIKVKLGKYAERLKFDN